MSSRSAHPLLRFLRAATSGPVAGFDLAPDAHALLAEGARRHGLSAWVAELLPHVCETVPGQLVEALRADAAAIVAKNLQNRRLLKRTLTALAEEGVTPVLLKGLGFAARYYPGPLLRPSSDVDVLVAPAQLRQSVRALVSLGLSKSEDPGVEEGSLDTRHLAFLGDRGLVELHFRALHGFGASTLELADLEDRCVDATWEGHAVRYLGPEDEFVYLAAHAATHLFGRLSWALDLQLLRVAHPELDWARVGETITRGGLANAVTVAWGVGETLFAWEPLPQAARLWSARTWRGRAIGKRLTPAQLVTGEAAESRLESFLLRTAMADDLGGVVDHALLGARRFARRGLLRSG